jgi:hypothetical protein
MTNDSVRIALSRYDRWLWRNSDIDAVAVDQYYSTVEPVLWESLVPSDLAPPEFKGWRVAGSLFPLDFESLHGNRRLWNALNSRLDTESGCVASRKQLLATLESAVEVIESDLAMRGQPVQ